MKKTITKLSLNKSTISNLSNLDMHQKIGGKKSDIFCGPVQTAPPVCPASGTISNCGTRNCPVKK